MAMWNGLAMGKHTREKDGKIKMQEKGELSTASTSSITYNPKMKSTSTKPHYTDSYHHGGDLD
jgi:hypothetical protein